jgi:nitrite reductase/ring-hydroxylating ferredoxin subunit/uncharacterized membrane protein
MDTGDYNVPAPVYVTQSGNNGKGIDHFWRRQLMYRPVKRLIKQQTWLDSLGDPLQKFVSSLFSDAGESGKDVKDLLNGTWLGHPLHPVLTDVPVGAWVCTALMDTLAGATGDEGLEKAADITLATGLLAAFGAAATGWTDWSDTYGDERTVGLAHGLTMVAAVSTYSLSLLARLTGARGLGVLLGHTGLALVSAGAYLGGDEVFDLGYGVNHTAFIQGPGEFVPVISREELQENAPVKADAKGVAVVLVRQGNKVFALDDTCVHAGCSLAGGKVDGESIVCPCHGSTYDLSDGSVIRGPATMPEPHYETRINEGMVEVRLAAE